MRFQKSVLGHVSRKSRKPFGNETPCVKLRLSYSVKLVFSYFVRRIKIKITLKSCASKRLCFEDTKKIMSPEMRPKSFGTFEKRAPEFVGIMQWNSLKYRSGWGCPGIMKNLQPNVQERFLVFKGNLPCAQVAVLISFCSKWLSDLPSPKLCLDFGQFHHFRRHVHFSSSTESCRMFS